MSSGQTGARHVGMSARLTPALGSRALVLQHEGQP
jgi:hypothetical protein